MPPWQPYIERNFYHRRLFYPIASNLGHSFMVQNCQGQPTCGSWSAWLTIACVWEPYGQPYYWVYSVYYSHSNLSYVCLSNEYGMTKKLSEQNHARNSVKQQRQFSCNFHAIYFLVGGACLYQDSRVLTGWKSRVGKPVRASKESVMKTWAMLIVNDVLVVVSLVALL